MKQLFLSIIVVVFCLLLAACSTDFKDASSGEYYASAPGGGSFGSPSASPGEDSKFGENEGGNQNRPAPGQLTSGEWSDIKNYDFYLNLFTIDVDLDIEESQRRNGYTQYIEYFGFETRYMVTVSAVYNDLPVNDAEVELYDSNNNLLYTAKTDKRGNAYLFPPYDLNNENITVKVSSGSYGRSQSLMYTRKTVQISLENREEAQRILDIMFVVDTTGSMGDELRYLKSEISDVIGAISGNNPNYTINLALLFYRDIGDEYVTKYFDFSTNITRQQQNLAQQSANGGGDWPEAADKALEEAVAKNWSGNATRLIFHVCDAPPHDNQGSQTIYFNAIKAAAKKGIRIIPIASSGIDLRTEYLLRQEALMTGGTYIFLTDDSGIGNSHLQPTVGEYTVEYLNACMIRIVNEYLTGIETKPVSYY